MNKPVGRESIARALDDCEKADLGGGVRARAETLAHLYSRCGFLLKKVDQLVGTLFGQHPDGGGMTLLQTESLYIASVLEPIDQIGLARTAGLDKSTAALIVDNLTKKGLIAAKPDAADRRRKLIRLKPLGRNLLERALIAYRQAEKLLMPGAPSEATSAFLDLLTRLAVYNPGGAPPWTRHAISEAKGPGRRAGLDRLFSSPVFLVRRSLQNSEAIFERETACWNLTPRQYGTLSIVANYPGISQAGAACMLGRDLSTTTLVLDILERKELITRRRSLTDRRRLVFAATVKGKDLCRDAWPSYSRSEEILVAAFTETEREALCQHLFRIVMTHRALFRLPLPFAPAH